MESRCRITCDKVLKLHTGMASQNRIARSHMTYPLEYETERMCSAIAFLTHLMLHTFLDDLHVLSTIRHNNCILLVPYDKPYCSVCTTYVTTLRVQAVQMRQSATSVCTPSSGINLRYFSFCACVCVCVCVCVCMCMSLVLRAASAV